MRSSGAVTFLRVTVYSIAALSPNAHAAAVRQDPPDVTWGLAWNFDQGTEGWIITDSIAADAYLPRWVDPAAESQGPVLPDGAVSGAGGSNLYLPDGATARISLPGAPVSRFVLQADIYVPNLSPIGGFPAGPGNWLHNAGIAALRPGDDRPVHIRGDVSTVGFYAQDRTWDGSQSRASWLGQETQGDIGTWWDQPITLRIDYNWPSSGAIRYYARVPWAWGDAAAPFEPGWYLLVERPFVNPSAAWSSLLIGQIPGFASWTQAQWDNVRYVPEPRSCGIAIAAAWLAGRSAARRRGARV